MSVRPVMLGGMATEIPRALAEAARLQAGVVGRRQALGAGLSSSAIASKIEAGRWRPVYPGVYATFTGPVTREARLWAAVLYAGSGAQLSHETAAEVLQLTSDPCPLIHLTIPAERRVRPVAGMAVHRSSYLETGWRFARGVPPHTWFEETITDLVAAAVNVDDAVAWVTRGFQRNRVSEGRLRSVLAQRAKLRWRDRLDEVIALAADGTHSPLEYRYDRDVERAHGLPPAGKQVAFTKPDGSRGFRDRWYEKYGLAVELDGRRYHGMTRLDDDRRRDNDVTAAAGATLRYDWGDVTRTPCRTAAQVHGALRERGYPGPLRPCSGTCAALSAPVGRPFAAVAHDVSAAGASGKNEPAVRGGRPPGRA